MSDHAAAANAHDAHGAHDAHDATSHHDGHDNSPEAIRKEIRKYLMVFGALAVLTVITVAISLLHLPTHLTIALALTVALVKGSLVAAFFMHLISERKLIFAVLAFTFFFFGMLLWGPWHQRDNAQKVWPHYDLNAASPAPTGGTAHETTHEQPEH
ncbi:MAG TPA: cytochrome C oxidase subunit IV family protein [Thermoanaerobaculia bacterium]|nr:cytochrome C oxidase subunit IV family protein [Thermoanaerobaculia bacterium]